MSHGDGPVVDDDRLEGAIRDPRHPLALCWPPRPSTVVAALIVGSSLAWMNFIDQEFPEVLSEKYGWPFSYRLTSPSAPAPSATIRAAALAVDVATWGALLVSACATTQLAACLLVRSPRLRVHHLALWVIMIALFLAGCRLKRDFLIYFFCTGFYYGLASLIVLLACLLLRLELPGRDEPEVGDESD